MNQAKLCPIKPQLNNVKNSSLSKYKLFQEYGTKENHYIFLHFPKNRTLQHNSLKIINNEQCAKQSITGLNFKQALTMKIKKKKKYYLGYWVIFQATNC